MNQEGWGGASHAAFLLGGMGEQAGSLAGRQEEEQRRGAGLWAPRQAPASPRAMLEAARLQQGLSVGQVGGLLLGVGIGLSSGAIERGPILPWP